MLCYVFSVQWFGTMGDHTCSHPVAHFMQPCADRGSENNALGCCYCLLWLLNLISLTCIRSALCYANVLFDPCSLVVSRILSALWSTVKHFEHFIF